MLYLGNLSSLPLLINFGCFTISTHVLVNLRNGVANLLVIFLIRKFYQVIIFFLIVILMLAP